MFRNYERDISVFDVLRWHLPPQIYMASSIKPGDPKSLMPEEALDTARMSKARLSEFAAGRSCAREALRCAGVHGQAIRRNQDRSPIWPSGIMGSLSHTSTFCVAIVAHAIEIMSIGIDIEIFGRITPDLIPLILTTEERKWIERQPEHRRAILAAVIFSAKEAYFKFQYTLRRQWLDFLQAIVSFVDDHHLEVTLVDSTEIVSGIYAVDDKLVSVCVYQLRNS